MFDETLPSITRISVDEANAQREFTMVGEQGVICSLQCFGEHIPSTYNRVTGWTDVFLMGIKVLGHDDSYYGVKCKDHGTRLCVMNDELLRRAIEK